MFLNILILRVVPMKTNIGHGGPPPITVGSPYPRMNMG